MELLRRFVEGDVAAFETILPGSRARHLQGGSCGWCETPPSPRIFSIETFGGSIVRGRPSTGRRASRRGRGASRQMSHATISVVVPERLGCRKAFRHRRSRMGCQPGHRTQGAAGDCGSSTEASHCRRPGARRRRAVQRNRGRAGSARGHREVSRVSRRTPLAATTAAAGRIEP